MKSCRDCKYSRRDIPFFMSEELDKCKHPKSIWSFASTCRTGNTDCGREAKWFEPKTPRFMWLRRLFTKPAQPKPEFNFEESCPETYSWSRE